MSGRTRELVVIGLIVALAISAFAAGYLVNEAVDIKTGSVFAKGNDDSFDVYWEAWGRIQQSFLGELPSATEQTYAAIRGSLEELNDPYTVFVEPAVREQERDSLRGNFGGIGVNLVRDEAGNLVLSPIPGNPGEKSGILAGDVLVAVDGQPLATSLTVTDIANLIRGEVGDPVTLTVVHPGESEAVDIVIVRAVILLPSVSYRLLEEDESIGYIQLTRFSGESAGEVENAIRELQGQGAQKLILDLRHNGGGLLEAAVDVSDLFLEGGPVLYQRSRGEAEKTYMAHDEAVAGDIPLVVLVDGATASSSEIVAGALQDRDRATLMGTKTFGKGSVQLAYDLSDGSSVHVTSARWYTPNRHQIDLQGLEPDVSVEPSEEAIASGRDEALEQAVAFLQDRQN